MKTITFNIAMMGKPRMTQRDKWAHRPAVDRYFALKDQLVLAAAVNKFICPDEVVIFFYLPMPASWSQKKKAHMEGLRHQQKPDIDNLQKAFLDCLHPNDCTVYHVDAYKYWSTQPRVVVDYDM